MLRSLMTAVTGVRAHQTMLDVTGNNISNANTTGFKKDNTLFADLMYQASKYASSADGSRGGSNPAQVGLGVSVAAIETIHTQGSSSYTGNASDMMIQERGFFVYTDGTNQLFSRSGACTLDGNSDLVQSGSGYKLQGYKMEETALEGFQQAAELSTINIPLGQKIEAKATTRVDYQCNLDSRQKNFLSYGFADLPFNAVAGANDLNGGQAKVSMNGTNYDMSFKTDFSETPNGVTSTGTGEGAATTTTGRTGINYLNFTISNAGEEAVLTFAMEGIDSESGKPILSLPKLVENITTPADPTTTPPTAAVYGAPNPSASVGTNGLVGWINLATGQVNGTYPNVNQATLDRDYAAVYQFPGQVPPQYFAAQYDDSTGVMKIRNVKYTGASLATGTDIKVDETVFTYDVKSKMDYTSFSLSGSPTIAAADRKVNQKFDFLVEFDESMERQATEPSKLGKTVSKMTLWYYGYSNSDLSNTALLGAKDEEIQAGTVTGLPKSMHKLEADVYFNADGTFDSVAWSDTNNANAPLGYRIVSGVIPPDAAGTSGDKLPNLWITPDPSSTSKTALNIMQAQNLDSPSPADVSSIGSWKTVGTTSQGGFHATKATIYDDNGKEHTLEVTYKKITENRWRWEAFIVEKDENGNDVTSDITPEPRTGEIEFDGSGQISNAIAYSSNGSKRSTENAEVAITIPFSLNGQPNSVVTLNFGGSGNPLLGVTQFASETTTKPVYQDGYTMGILKNYSVAANGTITGSYSNGVSIPLYRVALATFANEQGLEKVGNTMFQASVNSGTANIDGAGSNGKGTIMGQYVEMSNVDLTEEFTHLIIAQRGFQANTRVVTVSDQILEEVVNLKR